MNRVTAASDITTNGTQGSRTMSYDQYGNMWVTGSSGYPLNPAAPTSQSQINAASNRLPATLGAAYDAAGNMTSFGSGALAESMTYDAENRQTVLTDNGASTAYTYDGDGKRVTKTSGGVTTVFVYDAQGELAAEYGPQSAGGGAAACQTCYLSWDHLGTTRMVTDQAGNILARHDFMPFGEEIVSGFAGRTGLWGDPDGVNQKFTGKERDLESGLDYFGARYYGSALGRFTSPDEFKDSGITDPSTGKVIFTPGPLPYADIENPQSLNKYAYVLNNPLRYTDPTGHCVEDACVVEVAIAVGVASGSISVGDIVAGIGAILSGGAAGAGGNHTMTPYGIGENTGLYASQMSANKPGTLSKPDHQQTANEEAEKMGGQREVTIKTPGGQKESRRADAAKVDENGNVKEVTQVYRPTPAGNIPKREVDAANDIQNATGVKPNMVPVRPVKPPCTNNSGGSCPQ